MVNESDIQTFTQNIADRVRGLRAQRGMTRKNLADNSDVSERYLAQIETAKANISIGILMQLAAALNVELGMLLPSRSPLKTELSDAELTEFLLQLSPQQRQVAQQALMSASSLSVTDHHGLALIGLRGAGKTTLGGLAAAKLNIEFMRQGDLIEQQSGMQAGELFSLGGQQAYRRREYQAIEDLVNGPNKVVFETGGSLVSEQQSYDLLRKNFYTVWIQTSPEEHMERVIAQNDLRPITNRRESMVDLKLILQERTPMYQQANYYLDTSGRDIDECVDELLQVYQRFCQGQ